MALAYFNVRGLSGVWTLFALVLGVALFPIVRSQRPLPVLFQVFPVINSLLAHEKQVSENRTVIERILGAMTFYGVGEVPADFVERLARSVPAGARETTERYCASRIADTLTTPAAIVTDELVLLLFHEYFGQSTTDRWQAHRHRLAGSLARVLRRSGRLSASASSACLEAGALERVLVRIEDFHLSTVQKVTQSIDTLWRDAVQYREFLAHHDVAPVADVAVVGDLLDILLTDNRPTIDLSVVERASLEVLQALGARWWTATLTGERPPVESLMLVSLAVFFTDGQTNRPGWKTSVCRHAGTRQEALEITLAYLLFTKDVQRHRGDRAFVTLAYLSVHWRAAVDERRREHAHGTEQEVDMVRHHFQRGDWPTRHDLLMFDTFREAGRQSPRREGLHRALEKRPSIQAGLPRVVAALRGSTIRRYLEVRTINPYLLTFKSEGGTVRALLACLGCLADKRHKRLRPRRRQLLQRLGIALEVGGRPIYNFQQYTDHVRVGVVPRGWDLDTFWQAFESAFNKLIDAQHEVVALERGANADHQKDEEHRDLKDMELIVHEFGLASRSYFGFVRPGITTDRAFQSLRTIFGDILKPDELLELVEYQGRVPLSKAIMQAPIVELIESAVHLTRSEKKVLRENDAALRTRIVETVRVPGSRSPSLRSLGRYIARADDKKREAAIGAALNATWSAVGGVPHGIDLNACGRVAEAYLDTLAVIANIDLPPDPGRPTER